MSDRSDPPTGNPPANGGFQGADRNRTGEAFRSAQDSENCPRCSTFAQVAQDAEDSGRELQLQVDALNRALSTAEKRERNLQAKLERQHEEDAQAPVIRSCLGVWAEHCYGGRGKPKLQLNGKRAALIRKALSSYPPEDICDAFRGLGLKPYQGDYGKRAAAPSPGFTRKSDVDAVLRITEKQGLDEGRLERFRDYYRRVQASPADRLMEQWEDVMAVQNRLFSEVLRARDLEDREREQEEAGQRGHLFVIEGGKEKEAA